MTERRSRISDALAGAFGDESETQAPRSAPRVAPQMPARASPSLVRIPQGDAPLVALEPDDIGKAQAFLLGAGRWGTLGLDDYLAGASGFAGQAVGNVLSGVDPAFKERPQDAFTQAVKERRELVERASKQEPELYGSGAVLGALATGGATAFAPAARASQAALAAGRLGKGAALAGLAAVPAGAVGGAGLADVDDPEQLLTEAGKGALLSGLAGGAVTGAATALPRAVTAAREGAAALRRAAPQLREVARAKAPEIAQELPLIGPIVKSTRKAKELARDVRATVRLADPDAILSPEELGARIEEAATARRAMSPTPPLSAEGLPPVVPKGSAAGPQVAPLLGPPRPRPRAPEEVSAALAEARRLIDYEAGKVTRSRDALSRFLSSSDDPRAATLAKQLEDVTDFGAAGEKALQRVAIDVDPVEVRRAFGQRAGEEMRRISDAARIIPGGVDALVDDAVASGAKTIDEVQAGTQLTLEEIKAASGRLGVQLGRSPPKGKAAPNFDEMPTWLPGGVVRSSDPLYREVFGETLVRRAAKSGEAAAKLPATLGPSARPLLRGVVGLRKTFTPTQISKKTGLSPETVRTVLSSEDANMLAALVDESAQDEALRLLAASLRDQGVDARQIGRELGIGTNEAKQLLKPKPRGVVEVKRPAPLPPELRRMPKATRERLANLLQANDEQTAAKASGKPIEQVRAVKAWLDAQKGNQ